MIDRWHWLAFRWQRPPYLYKPSCVFIVQEWELCSGTQTPWGLISVSLCPSHCPQSNILKDSLVSASVHTAVTPHPPKTTSTQDQGCILNCILLQRTKFTVDGLKYFEYVLIWSLVLGHTVQQHDIIFSYHRPISRKLCSFACKH